MSCETVYMSDQQQIGDLQIRCAVIKYQDKYRCVRVCEEKVDIVCEGSRRDATRVYNQLQAGIRLYNQATLCDGLRML